MGAYASVIDLYAFCISLQFLYVHFVCLFQWVNNLRTWNFSSRSFFLGRGCSWRGVRSPNYCQLSEAEDRDHIYHLVHVTVVERTCVCPFDFQRRTPYVSGFFYFPCPLHYPMLTAPLFLQVALHSLAFSLAFRDNSELVAPSAECSYNTVSTSEPWRFAFMFSLIYFGCD